ncbi:MAG: hypothetical protein DMG49_15195 [Acidobacteria bacterium]|nr:MAG: hypothetical protein DMG49_15195 [Acidobacteriota bacterium]
MPHLRYLVLRTRKENSSALIPTLQQRCGQGLRLPAASRRDEEPDSFPDRVGIFDWRRSGQVSPGLYTGLKSQRGTAEELGVVKFG